MSSYQRDLFSDSLARSIHRQGKLFDQAAAADSDLACEQCGALLVQTPSAYLCCPNGHGRLRIDQAAAEFDGERDSGLWFHDDLPEPPPDYPPATLRAHSKRMKGDR